MAAVAAPGDSSPAPDGVGGVGKDTDGGEGVRIGVGGVGEQAAMAAAASPTTIARLATRVQGELARSTSSRLVDQRFARLLGTVVVLH